MLVDQSGVSPTRMPAWPTAPAGRGAIVALTRWAVRPVSIRAQLEPPGGASAQARWSSQIVHALSTAFSQVCPLSAQPSDPAGAVRLKASLAPLPGAAQVGGTPPAGAPVVGAGAFQPPSYRHRIS